MISPMSRTARRISLPVLAWIGIACSQYPAFDSEAHLRMQYAEQLGAAAAEVAVPYQLNPEIQRLVEERVGPAGSERRRVEEILDLVFRELSLDYALTPTRNAVETFEAREGNCLSFVNLFVGIARHRRLNAFYVEVEDRQRWDYRQGVVVSRGHIVAGLYLDGELSTFDFLPYRPKSYRVFEVIDDVTASAHYYNNLGAEALMAEDLQRAEKVLSIATGLAPSFKQALNNLGVLLLRRGETEEAVAIFERGLESDPRNVALLSNLARAYQQLGRQQEALELLSRIEGLHHTNPFFFVYRGELALAQGQTEEALGYMVKALRRDSEIPEVHLGLVKVYLTLGELERARHHLERALRLDATHAEARRYAALLQELQAGGADAAPR